MTFSPPVPGCLVKKTCKRRGHGHPRTPPGHTLGKKRLIRDSGELHLPRYKTAMGQSTFEYAAAKEWNDLPKELRACKTLGLFKLRTFKFLIELDKTQHICSV